MSRDSFVYRSVTLHDRSVALRTDHAARVFGCASATERRLRLTEDRLFFCSRNEHPCGALTPRTNLARGDAPRTDMRSQRRAGAGRFGAVARQRRQLARRINGFGIRLCSPLCQPMPASPCSTHALSDGCLLLAKKAAYPGLNPTRSRRATGLERGARCLESLAPSDRDSVLLSSGFVPVVARHGDLRGLHDRKVVAGYPIPVNASGADGRTAIVCSENAATETRPKLFVGTGPSRRRLGLPRPVTNGAL